MTSSDEGRHIEVLADLVELRKPVEQLVAALAPFGWDHEDELVTFTRADAAAVLERFLQGRISGDGCAIWAEAIEGRDDIGLEQGHEEILKEFLFEVSSPEINGKLTAQLAHRWLTAFESR
jgi:hypothetical protein